VGAFSSDRARTCVIQALNISIYALCMISERKCWLLKLNEVVRYAYNQVQGVHFSFVSCLRTTFYTFANLTSTSFKVVFV